MDDGFEARTVSDTEVRLSASRNGTVTFTPWSYKKVKISLEVDVGIDADNGQFKLSESDQDEDIMIIMRATKNGAMTVELTSGIEVTFEVNVPLAARSPEKSSIQESGEHTEKSCLVHSGSDHHK